MNVRAQPGEIVDGRYRVVKLIGRGSMADVFSAEDTQTGAGVALKILRGNMSANPEAVKRLEREAEAQRRIDHRNVARIYASGLTHHKEPYLAVELLRGASLRRIIKQGAIDVPRAASYAWQTLQGLHAAHTEGVLHRDLKPANIMLEASPGPVERVVLIDFGFADLRGKSRLTVQGQVVGSLSYLAPERLSGDRGAAAADLYGLGVILYELLCGRRPFQSDNEFELIRMHLEEKVPPPSTFARDIPSALEAVIMQALAKDPTERAPSALAMSQAIEQAMADYASLSSEA